MKKNWKHTARRGLASLLSLVICLSMLQLTVFAEETAWSGTVTTSDGEGVQVSGTQTTTTSEDGTVTTTETVYQGDNIDEGGNTPEIIVDVTGSETTVETTTTSSVVSTTETDAETVTSTTTTTTTVTETSGTEITTETRPGKPDVNMSEPEIEWFEEPGEPERWHDMNLEDGEDETIDTSEESAPLVNQVESEITVTFGGNEDGSLSGSETVAALDWDAFKEQMEKDYGLDKGALSELEQESDNFKSEDGNFEISVSEDGKLVTITEIAEDPDPIVPEVFYWEDKSTELTEDDCPTPDGYERVVGEDGVVTFEKSETVTNEDGSTTKTTSIITVTKSEQTGSVTATKMRTVTTTTFDLSNADLKLEGSISKLEEINAETDDEPENDVYEDLLVSQLVEMSGINEGLDEDDPNYFTKEEAANFFKTGIEQKYFTAEGFTEWWTVSGKEKEFYDYLTYREELSQPEITGAKVTLITGEKSSDDKPAYTAVVNFTLQVSPSVTGDLLVNINGEDGEKELMRINLDGGIGDDCDVIPEGNGVYKITIHNVKLSSNSAPVNLTIVATEKALTRKLTVNTDVNLIEDMEDALKATYDLSETKTTRMSSATLLLDLTGGVVTKQESEKRQGRDGMATVTKTEITRWEQIITELKWSDIDTDTSSSTVISRVPKDGETPAGGDDPAPPPTGGGGGGGTSRGGRGGGGRSPVTISPVTINNTPVPLAGTPVTELAEELVPLAETPETPVPLAETPEGEPEEIENVPLADVPETGDGSGMWYAIALTALCGLAALTLKKREEEA